jgi:hypothetical protein
MSSGVRKRSNSEDPQASLRRHISDLRAARDELDAEIGNAERALKQLLSATGDAHDRLIDVAKVWLLKNREGTYVDIRDYVAAYAAVVIRGSLDHRLRQSLSRAVAGGTVVASTKSNITFYHLSKKERDRLRKLYS